MFISLLLQERNPLHVTLVAENLQGQTRRKDTPKYTPSHDLRRPRAQPPVTKEADDDPGEPHHHHPYHLDSDHELSHCRQAVILSGFSLTTLKTKCVPTCHVQKTESK